MDKNKLRAEVPEEMSFLERLVSSSVTAVEDNPEYLTGQNKKAVVIDELERTILTFYDGAKLLVPVPPVLDLAIKLGVPHFTETLEMVQALRPLIEDLIEDTVDKFNNLGWFKHNNAKFNEVNA